MKTLVLLIQLGEFIVTWFCFILALWFFIFDHQQGLGVLFFIMWLTLLPD